MGSHSNTDLGIHSYNYQEDRGDGFHCHFLGGRACYHIHRHHILSLDRFLLGLGSMMKGIWVHDGSLFWIEVTGFRKLTA